MNKSDLALERVHNLYILQTELIRSLDDDLRDPKVRQTVRQNVRQFQELLDLVDWRYMGGPDLLDSLRLLPGEIAARLKVLPAVAMQKTVKARTAKRAEKALKKTKPKAKKAVKKAKRRK